MSTDGRERHRWTFITVTYNNAKQLTDSWGGVDLGEHEWLVVDNDSADGSAETAESLGATVIRRRDNTGFSSANNVGLSQATTEWIAFVNPDLTPDVRSLDRIRTISAIHSSLVAPQLINEDGTLQPNARGFPTIAQKLANRGIGARRIDTSRYVRTEFAGPTYIAWSMGAALCGPRTLFEEIGAWDSRYFIYYEDHDIGLRSWQAGHPVILDPDSRWTHSWQRDTSGFRFSPWKHELRSAKTFYRDYPEFLKTKRTYETGRFSELANLLWSPVDGECAGRGRENE